LFINWTDTHAAVDNVSPLHYCIKKQRLRKEGDVEEKDEESEVERKKEKMDRKIIETLEKLSKLTTEKTGMALGRNELLESIRSLWLWSLEEILNGRIIGSIDEGKNRYTKPGLDFFWHYSEKWRIRSRNKKSFF